MLMQPLAIDLFCGLGGWTEGLLAEGYYVVGFDIVKHVYGQHRYPAQLVIQDVLTLHGKQFKDATLIVGSSPCQEFSWRAMPWKAAKAAPPPHLGMALFNAQFRIQKEACEAAGRHIPMVVENVRGAQPWIGRSRWNYGSYHLWGDVPALMPMTMKDSVKVGGLDWNKRVPGQAFNTHAERKTKNAGGSWFAVSHNKVPHSRGDAVKWGGDEAFASTNRRAFNVAAAELFGPEVEGVAYERTADDKRQHVGIKRKYAAAMIAKIPEAIARHIARCFAPPKAEK